MNGSGVAIPVANQLPKLTEPASRDLVAEQNGAATLKDVKSSDLNMSKGLASALANPTETAAASTIGPSNVQGQQGLAGMLGSYRNMWQPDGGNNYQVVGGVRNII